MASRALWVLRRERVVAFAYFDSGLDSFLSFLLFRLLYTKASLFNFGFDGVELNFFNCLLFQSSLFFFVFWFFRCLLLQTDCTPLVINTTNRGWLAAVEDLSGFTPSNFTIAFDYSDTGRYLLDF